MAGGGNSPLHRWIDLLSRALHNVQDPILWISAGKACCNRPQSCRTPAVRLLLDSGLDSGLGSSSLNAEQCGNLRLVLLTELCSDKLYSDMSLSCKALALAGKAGAEHPCSSPLSPLHQLGTNIRLSY